MRGIRLPDTRFRFLKSLFGDRSWPETSRDAVRTSTGSILGRCAILVFETLGQKNHKVWFAHLPVACHSSPCVGKSPIRTNVSTTISTCMDG